MAGGRVTCAGQLAGRLGNHCEQVVHVGLTGDPDGGVEKKFLAGDEPLQLCIALLQHLVELYNPLFRFPGYPGMPDNEPIKEQGRQDDEDNAFDFGKTGYCGHVPYQHPQHAV